MIPTPSLKIKLNYIDKKKNGKNKDHGKKEKQRKRKKEKSPSQSQKETQMETRNSCSQKYQEILEIYQNPHAKTSLLKTGQRIS